MFSCQGASEEGMMASQIMASEYGVGVVVARLEVGGKVATT